MFDRAIFTPAFSFWNNIILSLYLHFPAHFKAKVDVLMPRADL